MKQNVRLERKTIPISECRNVTVRDDEVILWWLGQAGFVLRTKSVVIAIDPYLSDSLAVKYKDHEFPHARMMPPPLPPEELSCIGYYLCTHAHSDHMDPGTIPLVARKNPACVFIVPEAERETARARGVPDARLVGLDDGESFPLSGGGSVQAIAAAHETLETDAAGRHRYLGYHITLDGLGVFHSGDAVPYPELTEKIKALKVDCALLPVNGRDAERSGKGIAGNFTVSEALDLLEAAEIPFGIAHHFGMFDFNTVDPALAAGEIEKRGFAERFLMAEMDCRYRLFESAAGQTGE